MARMTVTVDGTEVFDGEYDSVEGHIDSRTFTLTAQLPERPKPEHAVPSDAAIAAALQATRGRCACGQNIDLLISECEDCLDEGEGF